MSGWRSNIANRFFFDEPIGKIPEHLRHQREPLHELRRRT
jgi:hypothetical protein